MCIRDRVYTDKSTEVQEDEASTIQEEKDIQKGCLIQLLLNMAVNYAKMMHFSVAMQALREALALSEKNSQIYYRLAQVIACNKGSRSFDLRQAKTYIEKAIELKAQEKIFSYAPHLLKVLNIHNADEEYENLRVHIEKLLTEKHNKEKAAVKYLVVKAKELAFIEETLRKEVEKDNGHPENSTALNIIETSREMELMKAILKKYSKVISFHKECENKDQVKLALKEQQDALMVHNDMMFYANLTLTDEAQKFILAELSKEIKMDINNKVFQRKFEKVKISKAEDLFENASLNHEMLNYVMSEQLRKTTDHEVRRERLKHSNEDYDDDHGPVKSKDRGLFGTGVRFEALLRLVGIGIIFVMFIYIFRGQTPVFWSSRFTKQPMRSPPLLQQVFVLSCSIYWL
eukprot:TRINITY_DN1914_c0_g1_i12.p1 TRINITY_DN1914_c0_g1~~TRINITY_DN1914_c0_g1_i12.p1  ORF type:complete len:402 (-),score=69.84 TRINITY_DN1914_c0_g1_i12:186-1391(-)